MKKTAMVLVLMMLLSSVAALAHTEVELKNAVDTTAKYIHETVKNPVVDSVGGEWAIIGLARSGYEVPRTYFDKYYATVEAYVKARNGILHEKKYTEYSRVILALTAANYDPRDVGGYDLTYALGDFEKTIWQGLNGPIWALIALDTAGFEIPTNNEAVTQATRELYLQEILGRQNADGGFSLAKNDSISDVDITAMALQALAGYKDREEVAVVIEEALDCLASKQLASGGFSTFGDENIESTAQIIVALNALGMSVNDPRFTSNGKTLIDILLDYRIQNGGFEHVKDSGVNQMATEQAFYALVSTQRRLDGKVSLYDMSDVMNVWVAPPEKPEEGSGLPGKHVDIAHKPVTIPGITFPDIGSYPEKNAIENLASRGIVNGLDGGVFGPEQAMTRAQFAAIIVRGLGLPEGESNPFEDVPSGEWHSGYISAAYAYKFINGKSDTIFDPNAAITRQEAATLIYRAAAACGIDNAVEAAGVRDMLAQFGDYMSVSDFAREPLAFCYSSGILSQEDLLIEPDKAITRGVMAGMFFRMLELANLL